MSDRKPPSPPKPPTASDAPALWITGANDTGIAAVNGNYAGEDNTVQGGVTITTLSGVSGNVATNAATESFDEPLTSAQVVALVAPFGVK